MASVMVFSIFYTSHLIYKFIKLDVDTKKILYNYIREFFSNESLIYTKDKLLTLIIIGLLILLFWWHQPPGDNTELEWFYRNSHIYDDIENYKSMREWLAFWDSWDTACKFYRPPGLKKHFEEFLEIILKIDLDTFICSELGFYSLIMYAYETKVGGGFIFEPQIYYRHLGLYQEYLKLIQKHISDLLIHKNAYDEHKILKQYFEFRKTMIITLKDQFWNNLLPGEISKTWYEIFSYDWLRLQADSTTNFPLRELEWNKAMFDEFEYMFFRDQNYPTAWHQEYIQENIKNSTDRENHYAYLIYTIMCFLVMYIDTPLYAL